MTLCVPKAHGRKYQTGFINDLNQLLTNAVTPVGGGTTNWTYTWNLDGTLATKFDGTNTYAYTWDPGGDQRLLSMSLNGVTQVAFTYDSIGRMLTRTPYSGGVAGTPTTFEWEGWSVCREFSPAGTYRYYAPQGELITFDYTPTAGATSTYCVHSDANFGIRAITDSTGAIVAHYETDPWGNLLASSSDISFGFNYRFVGAAGVRWDAALGMYYMLNRFYDSQIQKFISRDPVGLIGSANLYAYVDNSPANNVDPAGLQLPGGGGGVLQAPASPPIAPPAGGTPVLTPAQTTTVTNHGNSGENGNSWGERASRLGLYAKGAYDLWRIGDAYLGKLEGERQARDAAIDAAVRDILRHQKKRKKVLEPDQPGCAPKNCDEILEDCRKDCVTIFTWVPEGLPGRGRNRQPRIRRCIRECMEANNCYNY
jgi:RHS repeat-associated protein